MAIISDEGVITRPLQITLSRTSLYYREQNKLVMVTNRHISIFYKTYLLMKFLNLILSNQFFMLVLWYRLLSLLLQLWFEGTFPPFSVILLVMKTYILKIWSLEFD